MAGKAGAIDAVVAAMKAHVDHAGVSEHACWALMEMCANNGTLMASAGLAVCKMLDDINFVSISYSFRLGCCC